MAAVGIGIRWKNGNILHPSMQWKSPSKRRLPRLLIENRALEVAILVYIEDVWIIFHETNIPSEKAESTDAIELELYLNRFFLLPKKIKRQDVCVWIRKPENAILLWGKDNRYFVKPVDRNKFI